MKLQVPLFVALTHLLSHGGLANAVHPKVKTVKDPVPNHYIVTLKADPAAAAGADQGSTGPSVRERVDSAVASFPHVEVESILERSMKGFIAKMTPEEADAMAESDDVESIEQDERLSLTSTSSQPGGIRSRSLGGEVYQGSSGLSWGLDRIDQDDLPLDNSPFEPYGNGEGVTVYIVATGIQADHVEFEEGQVRFGVNTSGDGKDGDCNGQGTAVASLVGGKTVGVAKKVRLVDVKVYNCNGGSSTAEYIEGLEWIMEDVDMRNVFPAIAQMTVAMPTVKEGINAAVRDLAGYYGVVPVAAAGHYVDSCKSSPSSEDTVITVAGTDSNDRATSWGYGDCIDIYAPGKDVPMAWKGSSNDNYLTTSGNSVAAGFVSGAIALQLQAGRSPYEFSVDYALANYGKVKDVRGGTPNTLLTLRDPMRPPSYPTTLPPSASPPSASPPPTIQLKTFKVTVDTDNYGYETSFGLWEVDVSTGDERHAIFEMGSKTGDQDSEDALESNMTYTFEKEIDTVNRCYVFKISDSWGDGICCDYGNGSVEMWLDEEEVNFDIFRGRVQDITIGNCG